MTNASGQRGETENTYDNSSIKRVTRKFAKQRQRNVQKKCAAHEKCLFFGGGGGADLKLRQKKKKLKKLKNKKKTCNVATLVQNEFISDVASFTTDVQIYLLQGFFFFVGHETRNIAVQLVLQQRCQKSCTFFVPVLPSNWSFAVAVAVPHYATSFNFFFKVNYNYINESFPFSPGYIYIVGLPWGKESNT